MRRIYLLAAASAIAAVSSLLAWPINVLPPGTQKGLAGPVALVIHVVDARKDLPMRGVPVVIQAVRTDSSRAAGSVAEDRLGVGDTDAAGVVRLGIRSGTREIEVIPRYPEYAICSQTHFCLDDKETASPVASDYCSSSPPPAAPNSRPGDLVIYLRRRGRWNLALDGMFGASPTGSGKRVTDLVRQANAAVDRRCATRSPATGDRPTGPSNAVWASSPEGPGVALSHSPGGPTTVSLTGSLTLIPLPTGGVAHDWTTSPLSAGNVYTNALASPVGTIDLALYALKQACGH